MKCAACNATNTPLYLVVTGGMDSSLCVDFDDCILRYRMGMTPMQYQHYLRAQSALVLAR